MSLRVGWESLCATIWSPEMMEDKLREREKEEKGQSHIEQTGNYTDNPQDEIDPIFKSLFVCHFGI